MKPGMTWETPKVALLAAIVGGVVLVDFITKMIVQRTMHLHQQIEVLGDVLRLTYIYNPGAAFGLHLGEHSRWLFLGLSGAALIVLLAMYGYTPLRDRVRLWALGFICAGALGNLLDRLRSAEGVVDFLDVGVGTVRWPVFNVADMAVTAGAVLLALSLWREDRQVEARV